MVIRVLFIIRKLVLRVTISSNAAIVKCRVGVLGRCMVVVVVEVHSYNNDIILVGFMCGDEQYAGDRSHDSKHPAQVIRYCVE